MGNSRVVGDNFTKGLRTPHYANGRLLTAEDLQAEQDAALVRMALLGQAAGAGIIEGLTVQRLDASRLWVAAGVGVNGDGQIVRLDGTGATLAINIQPDLATSDDTGRFQDCAIPTAGSQPIGEGAYLLTIVPASRFEGSAPLKSLPGYGNIAPCASRWEVEGLQFRAIHLTGSTSAVAVDQTRRNLLAHWCFGTKALEAMPHNPFDFTALYAGLDQIDPADFDGCDLPLAVFYWTTNGIAFVDDWSARRRVTLPYPASNWEVMLSDKRVAQSQARFLQFQDQLATLGNPPAVAARQHFRYLPPVGFLPAKPPAYVIAYLCHKFITALLGTRGQQATSAEITQRSDELAAAVEAVLNENPGYGFDLPTFFGALMPNRIGLEERESVEYRLNRSWYDEALDLDHKPSFDLYIVEENVLLFIAAVFLQSTIGKLSRSAGNRKAAYGFSGSSYSRSDWAVVRGVVVTVLESLLRLDEDQIAAEISDIDLSLLYVMFVKTVAFVNFIEAPAVIMQPASPETSTAPADAPKGVVVLARGQDTQETVNTLFGIAENPDVLNASTDPKMMEMAAMIGLINNPSGPQTYTASSGS